MTIAYLKTLKHIKLLVIASVFILFVVGLAKYLGFLQSESLARTAQTEATQSVDRLSLYIQHQKTLLQTLVMATQEDYLQLLRQPNNPALKPLWRQKQKQILQTIPQAVQIGILDQQAMPIWASDGFAMKPCCRDKIEQRFNDFINNRYLASDIVRVHFSEDNGLYYGLLYFFKHSEKVSALLVSVPIQHLRGALLDADSRFDVSLIRAADNGQIDVVLSSAKTSFYKGFDAAKWQEVILASRELPGSRWHLVLSVKPSELNKIQYEVALNALLIVVTIFLVLFLVWNLFEKRSVVIAKKAPSAKRSPFDYLATALVELEPHAPFEVSNIAINCFPHAKLLQQILTVNQPFIEGVHPLDRAQCLQFLQERLTGQEKNQQMNLRLQNLGRSIEAVWVSIRAIGQESEGQVDKLLVFIEPAHQGLIQDVSTSEFIEQIQYPLVVTDKAGVLYEANRQAMTFLSQVRPEILDLPITAFMTLSSSQEYLQALNFYLQQGVAEQPEPLRCTFRLAAGEEVACDLQFHHWPSLFADGVVHTFTLVPQKAALLDEDEQELRFLEASLARFNIGSNIADELQELIAFLRGVSDRLKFTFVDKVSKVHADEIRTRSEAVSRSLNDFKYLAMLDDASEMRSFDAYVLMEEVIHLMRLKAHWHGTVLQFHYSRACPMVWFGNEARIKQVALQLLSYLLANFSSHEIKLQMNCSQNTIQKELFSIQFLAKVALHKMEESLLVLQDTIHSVHAGDWLPRSDQGLVLCQQIAQLMGGTIEVVYDNEQSIGLAFTVRLASEAADDESHDNEEIYRFFEQKPLSEKRILLVQNDQLSREIIKDILLRLGAEVDVVSSGVEALNLWRNYAQLYGIMLIELHSDVIQAHEVINYIRAEESPLESDRCFPIVVLQDGTETEEELAQLFGTASVFDMLQKPLIVEDLLRVVLDNCE